MERKASRVVAITAKRMKTKMEAGQDRTGQDRTGGKAAQPHMTLVNPETTTTKRETTTRRSRTTRRRTTTTTDDEQNMKQMLKGIKGKRASRRRVYAS